MLRKLTPFCSMPYLGASESHCILCHLHVFGDILPLGGCLKRRIDYAALNFLPLPDRTGFLSRFM